jgi:isopentenyl diphosphate isomerase/L-lactate dehydrogenase-like FMN-dependent dehydrogenase
LLEMLGIQTHGHGEEGVRGVVDMLRDEIDCAMAQLGRQDVKSVDSTMVNLRGAGK